MKKSQFWGYTSYLVSNNKKLKLIYYIINVSNKDKLLKIHFVLFYHFVKKNFG
jgi:hypothetical protein